MIKVRARFLAASLFVVFPAAGLSEDWRISSFITQVVVRDPGKTGLTCAPGTPVTLEVTGLSGAGDVAVSLSCADGKHFQKVRGKLEGYQEIKGCSNNLKPCSWADLGFGKAGAGGSRHPGGMNFLMADGSVRFVSNSVSSTKWRIVFLLPAVKK